MNYKSLRGYLLATSFLNIYGEDHNINGDLVPILRQLRIITLETCKRNKVSINKELNVAWNWFEDTIDETYTVSILTFALHFIWKNPQRDKYKLLTHLTNGLLKGHLFSKDEEVRSAKVLVNKFYSTPTKEMLLCGKKKKVA